VVEPADLAEHIADEARSALRGYEGPPAVTPVL
jgi:hypothetical protein